MLNKNNKKVFNKNKQKKNFMNLKMPCRKVLYLKVIVILISILKNCINNLFRIEGVV